MKKAILAALCLAGAASAYGQGQIQIDNLIGSAIIPILGVGGAKVAGANYNVEVFKFDASAANGIGSQLGPTINGIGANNRFRVTTGATTVDGVAAGNTVPLIVRAWDATGGKSYTDSTLKGKSANWTSKPLGGIDANNNIIITPKLDGFASFSLAAVAGPTTVPSTSGVTPPIPEPSTIALGALGAALLVLRTRK